MLTTAGPRGGASRASLPTLYNAADTGHYVWIESSKPYLNPVQWTVVWTVFEALVFTARPRKVKLRLALSVAGPCAGFSSAIVPPRAGQPLQPRNLVAILVVAWHWMH